MDPQVGPCWLSRGARNHVGRLQPVARDKQNDAVARANKAAVTTITDPNTRVFLTAANDSAMPLLDSVIPAKVALLYYVQLQAAFAGKVTPLKAMQNVEAGLKTLNP